MGPGTAITAEDTAGGDITAVDTAGVDTAATTAILITDRDMVTTWARGPLMPNLPPLLRPNPKLMPLPMLTTVITAMAAGGEDTTVDTTAIPTTTDTTVERGPLMPRLMLMPLLMLGTVITAEDTAMVVITVDTEDTTAIPMVDTTVVDTTGDKLHNVPF